MTDSGAEFEKEMPGLVDIALLIVSEISFIGCLDVILPILVMISGVCRYHLHLL